MAEFAVYGLDCGRGVLGISPIPGRIRDYAVDLSGMLAWEPALVLTMTTGEELAHAGAGTIGADLAAAGVVWRHLPVPDFGAPPPETVRRWPEASGLAHEILSNGGKILAHCFGGCGRSGMAVMRLMVEAGEEPVRALARLRQVRPCAVESAAQQGWAAAAFRSGT